MNRRSYTDYGRGRAVQLLATSGYFVAGFLTCAVMTGSLLLWASRTYISEEERDDD